MIARRRVRRGAERTVELKRWSLALLLGALALWSARPVAQGQAPPAKPTAPAKPAATAAGGGRLVEITATDASGKYLFKPDVINAKPGEALHVRIKAVAGTMGAMPKMAMSHNFSLLKSGSDPVAFSTAAVGAGFPANYTPNDKKDQII